MQIAISGNIGAGKTELTKLLSKHYGYKAVYGPSEENPYLNSFYEDMRRWSFNMMVHSLYAGVKELNELAKSGESFIRDRSLLDDVCVFAPNLQSMGLMTTRDFETYRELFEQNYPGQAHMIPDFWMPNRTWPGCDVNDPSARVLTNYGDSGK